MNHATAVADNRYWLERQRSLEFELIKARERQCSLKRAMGAPNLLGVPVGEGESDGWMLTYLDLITVLLVMVMAMLAQALIQRHAPVDAASARVLDIAGLTRVEAPGSLLLVPPVPAPAVVEPVVEAPPEPAVAAPVPEEPTNPLADLPLDQLGSDIEVIRNERSLGFRIDSSILFPSGQADLDPKGLEVLQRLAGVLKGLPHRILVAGHTDTRRIRNDRYPSNWELSGARAGSVVRFLQQQGIAGERMTAMGMAGTQPLADNGSVEGRARNRRVELTLEKREGS